MFKPHIKCLADALWLRESCGLVGAMVGGVAGEVLHKQLQSYYIYITHASFLVHRTAWNGFTTILFI